MILFLEKLNYDNWTKFFGRNILNRLFFLFYLIKKNKTVDIKGFENNQLILLGKKNKYGINNFPKVLYKSDFGSLENYDVLNGRWLFKYLIPEILNYIFTIQKTCFENEEISVLVNDTSDLNIEIIKFLASQCKVINVISESIESFNFLEKYCRDNLGVLINLTKNFKKGGVRSNLVLNLDFTQELLDKCSFNRYSVIINFTYGAYYKYKNFDGININFYKIYLPTKYIKLSNYLGNFDDEVIYESILYSRKRYDYIRNEILKDKLRIWYLIGRNGRICNDDFIRLKKAQKRKKKYREIIE